MSINTQLLFDLHSCYIIQWLYVLQIHYMPQLLKTQNTCLSAAEINHVVTSILKTWQFIRLLLKQEIYIFITNLLYWGPIHQIILINIFKTNQSIYKLLDFPLSIYKYFIHYVYDSFIYSYLLLNYKSPCKDVKMHGMFRLVFWKEISMCPPCL